MWQLSRAGSPLYTACSRSPSCIKCVITEWGWGHCCSTFNPAAEVFCILICVCDLELHVTRWRAIWNHTAGQHYASFAWLVVWRRWILFSAVYLCQRGHWHLISIVCDSDQVPQAIPLAHFLLAVIQPSISVILLQYRLDSNGLNGDLIGPRGLNWEG